MSGVLQKGGVMRGYIKKITAVVGIIGIIMNWSGQILAAPANHIVISEIQTASASDASQEFVELYNPTSSSNSLEGWVLEYASSSGTTWTKKSTLAGTIPAYGFYLIATTGYLGADATMNSGLAGSGGHVRIKNTNGTVIDLVGWGTAAHAEAAPVAAPLAGGSVERIPGRLSQAAGNGEDSDNNSNDFVQRETSEPQSSSSSHEDPTLVPPDVPDAEPDPLEQPLVITMYLPVTISEALPDPASPLTDAKDEFIELYNPNDMPVNLKGYVIRTGSDFKSYYTIGDSSIEAGGYLSFYSVDTKLGLVNSGGAVQVLDPLGNILDTTDPYAAAKAGQAWADINGVWMWTLEPTPGAANVLSQATGKSTGAAVVAKSSTKKVTTKTSSKKVGVKKTAKVTAKKVKTKAPKTGMAATTATITDPSPLARWLLIGAGCFTIMYAIYGFRHDLYSYYIKTRGNIATWISSRPALPWRRNH